MKRTIRVRCYRGTGAGVPGGRAREGSFQEYEVPLDGETSVQEALVYISDNLDPTLAFFKHAACRQGLCGRCTVRVNGKPCLACTTPVPVEQEPVTLEPASANRLIRDLLCATGDVGCAVKASVE